MKKLLFGKCMIRLCASDNYPQQEKKKLRVYREPTNQTVWVFCFSFQEISLTPMNL